MESFRLGEWLVEPTEGTVSNREGQVRLEPKVMQILVFLCRGPGRVISKDELLGAVWPDTHVQEVTLSRGISELRRHLGDDARDPRYIETLPKRGYRVIAPIAPIAPLAPEPPPRDNADKEDTSVTGELADAVLADAVPGTAPKPSRSTVTRHPRSLWLAAAFGVLALAWIVAWRTVDLGPDPHSVAVIPFQNLSGDPETDYFGQGIAEDILTRLSQIRRLRVVSVPADLTAARTDEIGRRLRVAAVLAGSVRRDGPRVRITARLVETASGRHLWADSFDRDLADLFDIQREVTDRIAGALAAELSSREKTALGRPYTARVTAYDTYLRAREQYRRYRPETNAIAIELFRRAIELDPDFALAHAGLASACVLQTAHHGLGPEWLQTANDAAREAAVLDPDLPEAHNALGMIFTQQGHTAQARFAFARALELRPGYEEARHNAAFLQYPLGRWDEGGRWQSHPETSRLR